MSDTPRTNFVAHATGDSEWDRSINRFGRMMAHACILERELAAAIEQRDKAVAALKHYGQHVDGCMDNDSVDCICGYTTALKECGK